SESDKRPCLIARNLFDACSTKSIERRHGQFLQRSFGFWATSTLPKMHFTTRLKPPLSNGPKRTLRPIPGHGSCPPGGSRPSIECGDSRDLIRCKFSNCDNSKPIRSILQCSLIKRLKTTYYA